MAEVRAQCDHVASYLFSAATALLQGLRSKSMTQLMQTRTGMARSCSQTDRARQLEEDVVNPWVAERCAICGDKQSTP